MYVTTPRNDLCSEEYHKTGQTGNQGTRVHQAVVAELSRWHDMHLHIVAFCIAPVEMLSQGTNLAARFFILVFSQLISSNAGNYTF